MSDTTLVVEEDAANRRRRGPRFDGDLMGALEASRDLMCVTINGIVTAVNSAGLSMLGADDPTEVETRRLLDFMVAEDEGAYDDGWLFRHAYRPEPIRVRMRRLTGEIRDVELHVYRAREVASGAAVVLGRDVTEHSLLATSVQRSEVRFRMLVENSMHLVVHCRGNHIDYINRAGVRMLGAKDAAEFIGRAVWDLFSADYRAIFTDNVEFLLGEQGQVPVRLARSDGELVDAQLSVTVFPSGDVLDYMIEATDITAHNRAVSDLRSFNEELEQRVIERTAELHEQKKVAEEEHRLAVEARHFMESLLEAVPSPLWYKDAEGRYRAYNRAFREVLGVKGNSWIGRRLGEVRKPEMAAIHEEVDSRLLNAGDKHSYEVIVRDDDGAELDVLMNKTTFIDAHGSVAGIIGMMVDISERKAMERELRRLATTDAMTGAHCRRHFLSLAGLELERVQRHGRPLSVLMLDIDHFKRVNDTCGHAAGDEAIIAFVHACDACLRPTDMIGRLGGEEFAVLLPETILEGAAEVAERLRVCVSEIRLPAGAGSLTLSTSIGVTQVRPDDATIGMALNRADEALYEAKNAGRNQVIARF